MILALLPGVARGILKIQNKFGQFHPPGTHGFPKMFANLFQPFVPDMQTYKY